MVSNIKSEIINILEPVFGANFVKDVTYMYDGGNPEEIIELAHKMLSDYLGNKATSKIFSKLLEKHPELKKELKKAV